MAEASRSPLFTVADAWSGGFYQASFIYPPESDLGAALAALWSFPALAGPCEVSIPRAVGPAPGRARRPASRALRRRVASRWRAVGVCNARIQFRANCRDGVLDSAWIAGAGVAGG